MISFIQKSQLPTLKAQQEVEKQDVLHFFFAMKAIMDDMKRPFFIMTQPGHSIIQDKITDFQNIMSNSVKLVCNVNKMIKLFQKEDLKKTVIALFSPYNVLRLLSIAKNENHLEDLSLKLEEIANKTKLIKTEKESDLNGRRFFN